VRMNEISTHEYRNRRLINCYKGRKEGTELDESEDENSAHADEKRTEGKERGRNRRTNQLLFSHLSTI